MLELIWKFKPNINHSDEYDRTPLHMACKSGNGVALGFLIKHGMPRISSDGSYKNPE